MSELVKVEVSELAGAALDWAVAQVDPMCEGLNWRPIGGSSLWGGFSVIDGEELMCAYLPQSANLREQMKIDRRDSERYSPSRHWDRAGVLIDKKVTVIVDTENGCYADCGAQAHAIMYQKPVEEYDGSGPTMLIACMRAIVSSELGPEIEVPKELVT